MIAQKKAGFDFPQAERRIHRRGINMDPAGIVLVVVCLACLASVVIRVRALWQCWTGLLVVFGQRCSYVCGYSADDLLGLSSPQILDRRGKVFLVNGNEVRRLRSSELRTWLLEDELRVTEKNLKSYRKICVVRTHEVIGPLHNARPGYQTLRSDVR